MPAQPDEDPLPRSVPYANVCGAMLWISRMVRVDCMQRTAELARAMHAPTWRHWAHMKHLLAYLKSTLDEGLVYKQGERTQLALLGK